MRSLFHPFICLLFILCLVSLGCTQMVQDSSDQEQKVIVIAPQPDTDKTEAQGQEPQEVPEQNEEQEQEQQPEPELEGPKVYDVAVPLGTSTPGCEEDENTCYEPATLEIRVGDTVKWKNDDTAGHTVTSGSPNIGPTGTFDSSLFMAGTHYEFKFTHAGSYEYFCMVHPWQLGLVKVSEAPSGSPAPQENEIVNAPANTISVPQGTSVPGCEESDNQCFNPQALVVQQGETVTWKNDDTAAHTITSGTPANGPDGSFDSSHLKAGTTWSHTFVTPGTYPYSCMVHPWQTGTVKVE